MSDRYKKLPGPTPQQDARLKAIWSALSECFHYIESDEQAKAKGMTTDEHARRHALFAWAFQIGMEYMYTHPKRGMRLIRDKLAASDEESVLVDLMAETLLPLFPSVPADDNKVFEIADRYPQISTDVVSLKPVFTEDGKLEWEETAGFPFDWLYELETWEDSSE